MLVWRHLALRLKRLGVWKGVERRTSPYRLKNYGAINLVRSRDASKTLQVYPNTRR
jgi:hypothetical protein